jgi:hypothetical protein
MRCRCSFFSVAALFALLLFTAGAAGAQVIAGGNLPKGAKRVDVVLTAAAEVPGPGDPALSGTADLVVDPRRGRICYEVTLDGSSAEAENVVALHIHPGVAGTACSDPLECLAPIDLDFENEGLEGCVKKLGKQLLNSIVDEPEQYYLHVHTSRFPGGAVRGQLTE